MKIAVVNHVLILLAIFHTSLVASNFSYPSVLLWLVVLANAQVSRLLLPPAATVPSAPDAELRKDLDDLRGKVSAMSVAKGFQRR